MSRYRCTRKKLITTNKGEGIYIAKDYAHTHKLTKAAHMLMDSEAFYYSHERWGNLYSKVMSDSAFAQDQTTSLQPLDYFYSTSIGSAGFVK